MHLIVGINALRLQSRRRLTLKTMFPMFTTRHQNKPRAEYKIFSCKHCPDPSWRVLSNVLTSPHSTMAEAMPVNPPVEAGGLDKSEIRLWRDNYQWLHDRGYQLRPRYSPDWMPSWIGTKKYHGACEDGIHLAVSPFESLATRVLILFPR